MSDAPSPNPRSLSGAQRRALRALGHELKPTVWIGRQGVTDALVDATRIALNDHELIKLSVSAESPLDRKEAPVELARRTGGHVAQVIGRTALLYRRHPEKPTIFLPGTVDEGPRPPREKPVKVAAPRPAPTPARPSASRPAPAKGRPARPDRPKTARPTGRKERP